MIKLGMYTYERLYRNASPDPFVSALVTKTLRSMTRSTGSSIYHNKYLKAISFAHRIAQHEQTAEKRNEVLALLTSEVKKHERSFPLTSLRLELAIAANFHCYNGPAVVAILNGMRPRFEAKLDLDWLRVFAAKANFQLAGCGHFEMPGDLVYLQGIEEDPIASSTVCQICAQEQLASGLRVENYQFRLVLAAHAAQVRSNRGNIIDDVRRHRYVAAHNCYATQDWSPYANLIDGYHSSRSRGFTPIDSVWFRTHRKAFGCELEVQRSPNYSGNTNALAGKVHEVLNPSLEVGEYCYFERDGSIGDGFEIVTQPAGLDIHRLKFGLFLNNAAIKEGMRSHAGGACGFHVHVGRQYLSQSQIYRMQAFINDPRNKGLVAKIARRYNNGSGYARFKPELSSLSPNGKQSGDRYDALNVTNTDTVEFRIFRGSLRYESIIAALEFVNAMVEFCMPGQIPLNEFNSIGFRRYINRPENEEDTKFLRPYISEDANEDNEQRVLAAA